MKPSPCEVQGPGFFMLSEVDERTASKGSLVAHASVLLNDISLPPVPEPTLLEGREGVEICSQRVVRDIHPLPELWSLSCMHGERRALCRSPFSHPRA